MEETVRDGVGFDGRWEAVERSEKTLVENSRNFVLLKVSIDSFLQMHDYNVRSY